MRKNLFEFNSHFSYNSEDEEDLFIVLFEKEETASLSFGGEFVKAIESLVRLDRPADAASDQPATDPVVRKRIRFPFEGKWNSVVTVPLDKSAKISDLQRLASTLATRVEKSDRSVYILLSDELSKLTDLVETFLLGFGLRTYEFSKYKSKKSAKSETVTKIIGPEAITGKLEKAIDRVHQTVHPVHLARDLVNSPPSFLNPTEFMKVCSEHSHPNFDVEILDQGKLEQLGFRGLLAVGQASSNGSYVVCMRDRRIKDEDVKSCLIGKGVCFDSGGLSLKPALGMRDMKMDMAGAATVFSAMTSLCQRKKPTPVVGLIGLVENLVDSRAYKPGDILTMRSGKTVEVVNTDAEGRLVLADVLHYAQERYDPKLIIDVATLTGAVITALGHDIAGVFSPDAQLSMAIQSAASEVDEEAWPMPICDFHRKLIKSSVADIRQTGPAPASSISAAKFLMEFVDDGRNWAHLDIAGTAYAHSSGRYWPEGGTGWGVQTLCNFLTTKKSEKFL